MQYVIASGPPSEIMLVGDYPTNEEVQLGYSFSGGCKTFTNRLLSSHKWKTTDSYCTHAIKKA